ncbi:MAG: transposase [Gammaproteobacteria bacterium]|nr:transposase [Gammaproteobacteria bacterium]
MSTSRHCAVDTLKVERAWTIKESFAAFWDCRYAGSARNFFHRWVFSATQLRIQPIMAAAKTLKRHLPGLPAYMKHRFTNAVAKNANRRIQFIKANARGYRSCTQYCMAILFHCRGLDLYPTGCTP